MQLEHGAESFCYPEENEIKAMGYWTKPNDSKINLFTKIQAGLLKAPFKMGWAGFKRVLEISDAIDDQLKKAMGHESYLYLNNMVMDESRRGKGWGSKILANQFQVISKKNPNAVLALQTQRYWTVKLYEKLGFEVILEEQMSKAPRAFTNWTMKKTL